MTDLAVEILTILGTCLAIAGGALALVLLRPVARRRRRHKRHSHRQSIDLCAPRGVAPEKPAA
jgi:hypothetical protein